MKRITVERSVFFIVCLLCREQALKMLKVQKTKEEIEAFHKERAAWKQKERERMEEENR
jgi:hypothetical protein